MVDIVGIGAVLVDEMSVLPCYPSPDEKIEILQTHTQLGGPVPVALKALSSLGLSTFFVGKVGDDKNGEFIMNSLIDSGVDVSGMAVQKSAQTGYSQVWIDKKNSTRTIAYSNGTIDFGYRDVPELPRHGFMHFDGRSHRLATQVIDSLQADKPVLCVDTGNYRKEAVEFAQKCDVVIMPKRFAVGMFGQGNLKELMLKAVQQFSEHKMLVITDGVNGSICSHNREIFNQSAFEVDVVDSTGAGDVHSAGIIYGLMKGWETRKTLQFSAALAALKCKFIGNSFMPNLAQVQNFLEIQSSHGFQSATI